MWCSKVLFAVLLMPFILATSSNEAVFRCQKIYNTAQKDIAVIQESALEKTAHKALDLIQEIINSFSPASETKTVPNQIKRCVALGDLIKTIKEELAKKSQTNVKKDHEIKQTDTADEPEVSEEKPKKKPKHEKQIDPESSAINLSKQLKAIAENEQNSGNESKPTL